MTTCPACPAVEIIDAGLDIYRNRELVSAAEVCDLLIDIRQAVLVAA